jgi:SAM-dependent methyltransferase
VSLLERSWGSFSSGIAARYLKTYGYPAPTSKELLVDVLEELARERALGSGRSLAILDLGCGNAQLYEYFKERKLRCTYTGVDISPPLLDVAQQNHAGDPSARFLADDIVELGEVDGRFDVVLYSHVFEILSSPERSLRRARELAPLVVIRFYEPPEFEEDTVDLLEMEIDEGGAPVPYIRWKMSRDHYRLILRKTGCREVDVYRDVSKDQVHVLHYR